MPWRQQMNSMPTAAHHGSRGVGLYDENQRSLLEKGRGNAGKESLQTQRDIRHKKEIFVRILTAFGSIWYLIIHELCYMHELPGTNFLLLQANLFFFISIYLLRTFMNAESVCCACLQRSLKGGSL